MSALAKIRAIAADYAAAFREPVEETAFDRMLRALAIAMLILNVIVLVTAGGVR